MKRYLLFEFGCYYPYGGFQDFVFSTDSLGEIKHYLKTGFDSDNFQIIDTKEWKIIDKCLGLEDIGDATFVDEDWKGIESSIEMLM